MKLIHCALLCEAQTFIEKLKLPKVNSTPKIYANDKYVVLIGGVGEENTINSLKYIFKNFTFSKAYNVGIAGCSDKNIAIGSLFHVNPDSPLPLITDDKPTYNSDINFEKKLFDMEGKYFLENCEKYLNKNDIHILKIVSDHLDEKKLDKNFVKKIIFKNWKDLVKYLIKE